LSAWYVRAPRLFEEINLCHADGSFRKRLAAIAKIQLLVIDDFAIAPDRRTREKRSAGAPR
jgi:DNA replication protein DnaC